MAEAGCPFSQYCLPGLIFGSSFLALILLRLFGGKRLGGSEYLFGLWNWFAFVCHATVDTYFFYNTRVTPKAENEPMPKPDDYLGCFQSAIRKAWRQYGEADTRVFLDEFQPLFLTMTYGAAVGAGTLCFLTFVGHLFGRKWAHPMQIAAATWHIATMYNYVFPEYLVHFKHVKNMQVFAAVNLPFVIVPALALLSSLCKMSCGSCATVCPVSSSTASHVDQQKKKK